MKLENLFVPEVKENARQTVPGDNVGEVLIAKGDPGLRPHRAQRLPVVGEQDRIGLVGVQEDGRRVECLGDLAHVPPADVAVAGVLLRREGLSLKGKMERG